MIRVRTAQPADADPIAAMYAPHVVHGYASFEENAPDAAAIAARMAAGGTLPPWLVAADGDAVIGYAYATSFHPRRAYRWTVETSVYVADVAQGRGIGRLLYGTLLDTLVAAGFAQAVARISLPSEASVALHEALGFTATGVQRAVGYKHGRWIDVGSWQRPLAIPATPPAEPRQSTSG